MKFIMSVLLVKLKIYKNIYVKLQTNSKTNNYTIQNQLTTYKKY